MRKILPALLLLLALAACATPAASTPSSHPAEFQPCAYLWASQELPEISAALQAGIQQQMPEASARASAYGENCVAPDGTSTFSAMETDFYLTIPAADLKDDAALGALVEQALAVIDQFSAPRVPGPKEGFVEFTFTHGGDQRIVRVPIQLGKAVRAQGLHGAALIQAAENP